MQLIKNLLQNTEERELDDGEKVTRLPKRAGVIPFKKFPDGQIRMLFMVPSNPAYGGDRFQIAKGKIDDGENIKQAALREGKEELGLRTNNIESSTYIGVHLGMGIYVAKIKDIEHFDKPHFETGDVRWMTDAEFEADGRELHKSLVKFAYNHFIKDE
ncbi:hypothetical protein RsoM2USA_16 [Ralstonia phage RsoM2USA]|nr:hypothetical protein RsoM2USA_16 [Ralstonia phage RsoM2USA]